MGKYQIDQIVKIIMKNPQKTTVEKGRQANAKLLAHVYGTNLKAQFKRNDFFENDDIYKVRVDKPMSNKDMMARTLQEEELIFTSRGGSTNFNLGDAEEATMNQLLGGIRNGVSLRKWMQTVALPAYRTDPMGIIFMEIEQLLDVDGIKPLDAPKCYPTYKSIQSIYDYLPNGRNLEYVCFQLLITELPGFGIVDSTCYIDPDSPDRSLEQKLSPYFRFVDDEKDIIMKKTANTVVIVTTPTMSLPNPIKNDRFSRCPAIMCSDLIQFDDPTQMASPLFFITELSDDFLYDRSVRNLQKKFHGFAKAIEPLLKCPTCEGVGQIKGNTCPACTLPGNTKGSGYKLRTKVSDVAKFPLETLSNIPSFDFKKIFGFVAPPIETWDKQDLTLEQTSQIIYYTYWGCPQVANTSGPGIKDRNVSNKETATKTMVNLKPKYARLNQTADWAQRTENMLADFVGEFWFDKSFDQQAISYSRSYILETAEELMDQYYDMREKGAPESVLDEQMARYINCLYQDNPIKQTKFSKLLQVEPFMHDTWTDVEASTTISPIFKTMKRYFGRWVKTKPDIYFIATPIDKLNADLEAYAKPLIYTPPAPVVALPGKDIPEDVSTSPVPIVTK